MSYTFTRNKKKVFSFGGLFDPCIDQTQMENNWYMINDQGVSPAGPLWDVVSAPGGASGLAHRIHGNAISQAWEAYGFLSPFTGDTSDRNGSFPTYSPYKWRYKAEFRMYIVDDFDPNYAGTVLYGGAGFMLDGCYDEPSWASANYWRTMLLFNVTNQKVGICGAGFGGGSIDLQDYYTDDWAGSYDTWYDIRVYWEYDFFTDPTVISISVYSSDTLIFSVDMPIEEWRIYPDDTNSNSLWNHSYYRAFQGRCGLGADFYNFATGGNAIDVYFKDILITLDNPTLLSYTFQDSILRKEAKIEMKGTVSTSNQYEINKGTDIQLFRRSQITDDWSGRWRGTVRTARAKIRGQVYFEAEGVGIEFMSEKTEDLTLTTKTTAEIVIEALNNPTKGFINTTAYFDSVSNTYNRYYPNNPKIDILMEMAALEGFIEYFDIGNNFHFQSMRSNYSEIHLEWGVDRIFGYDIENITIRKPNRIRVNGSGVYALKHIIEETHTVGSQITREFNRPDITVQADADAALNYYASLYRKSIEILKLNLVENYQLQKGTIITVTIEPLNIYARKYLLTDITSTHQSICTINLLEVSPEAILYLAELGTRTGQTEGEDIALDTIADSPQHNIEGVVGLLISAEYEIEYSSTVVRSGKMIVTDDFIDDLLDVLDATATDDPTHIAIGTGITEAQYTDSALGSESTRAIASATKAGKIMDFDSYFSPNPIYYHKIKFERTVTDPTAITELGLFNAASVGTMTCRAAFASYTQTGSVTFRVTLILLPEPSSAYITLYGVNELITWLDAGSWTALPRMYHAFSLGFMVPNPTVSNLIALHYLGLVNYSCFVPATLKTLTKTILADLDQIIFEYTNSDFDSTDGCSGKSYPSSFICLSSSTSPDTRGEESFAMAWFFNEKLPSEYDISTCIWRIIIEIKRGEISY